MPSPGEAGDSTGPLFCHEELAAVALPKIWEGLNGHEVLALSRVTHWMWRLGCTGLLQWRLPRPPPFVMLTLEEQGAVLRFLHTYEESILFDNFASWDPGPWALQAATAAASFPGGAMSAEAARPPGSFQRCGQWELGPSTDALPHLQRVPRAQDCAIGTTASLGAPLSPWCLRMANRDPLTDLAPSGLVFRLRRQLRPRLLAYRCRARAIRPYRAGAVCALAEGLGNDKGPERPAAFMYLTSDRESRHINASTRAALPPVGAWRDNEWFSVLTRLDWDACVLRITIQADGEKPGAEKQVPFVNPACNAVNFLMMYNQTGDLEVDWADLLVL